MTLFTFGNTKNPSVVIVVDPKPPGNYTGSPSPVSTAQLNRMADHLKAAGLSRDTVCFIEACKDIPKEISTSEKKVGEIVAASSAELFAFLKKTKPRMVIAMGKVAARAVYRKAVKITSVRGCPTVDQEHGFVVFPMFSVSHVFQRPDVADIFDADFGAVVKIVKAGYDTSYTKSIETTYRWATEADLNALLASPPDVCSLDTEWTGGDWYDDTFRLLTVQFCTEPGKAITVPVRYANAPGYDFSQRKRIRKLLRRFLRNGKTKFFGHNVKSDWHALRAGLGVELQSFADDTILLAHAIDENMLNKSLDDCIKRWVPALSGYADLFNRDPVHVGKSRMDLVPPDKLLQYACGDVDATFRLREALLPILKKDKKNYRCYRRVTLPASRAFCDVEINGLPIDEAALRRFEEELREHQSKEHTRLLRFVPRAIVAKHSERELKTPLVVRPALLREFLFTHRAGLRLKPVVFTNGTKNEKDASKKIPSVSAKQHLPFFLDKHEFISGISDFIKTEKLLGTYVGDEDEGDGFWKYIRNGHIYPSYLLHKTVTGRTACVHADTLVPTLRGNVRIADIVRGDFVWTHRGRWKAVRAGFIKPAQDMYDVRFSNGETLRCTEDHRLLTDDGKWVSLRDVYFQETFGRREHPHERGVPLSRLHADYDSDCEEPRTYAANSHAHTPAGVIGGPTQAGQGAEILTLEKGGEKPSAWQETGQLQGRVRGWSRLFDRNGPWKTVFRASYRCSGTDARHPGRELSRLSGCAPHRREQGKQFTGQSCDSYESRAQENTRLLRETDAPLRITGIIPAGDHPVFDIEVDGDHSYEAASCFSHNSVKPNGQNLPKRGKFAKKYREIFVAPKGYVFVQADYSQIELRLVAAISGDPTLIRLYKEGQDVHTMTAAYVNGLTLEQFSKLPEEERELLRFRAKAVNFGFIYGMWYKKFRIYAKTDYGIDLTEDEAKTIRERFFSLYKWLSKWHESSKAFVAKHQYVRALDGRTRHLPMIRSHEEYIRQQAERYAINSPVQATASDLGLISLARLCNEAPEGLLRVCGFVHDAIICLVPVDRAIVAARFIRDIMESPPLEKWFGVKLPVPIVADVEIGTTLANLAKVKQVYLNDPKIESYAQFVSATRDKAAPAPKGSPPPKVKLRPHAARKAGGGFK